MDSIKTSDSKQPQLGPFETHLLALLCQRKNATVRDCCGRGKSKQLIRP